MPGRRGARSSQGADEPAERPSALDVAVRFLGTRPRSRWEVERRLARDGFDAIEIGAALERLTELGHLDDAAFARWWGEQRDRHHPRGRRMIEAELRQRGVSRDVIEAYRAEHAAPERAPEDEGLPGTEEDRAMVALESHMRGRPYPEDEGARRRLGMFLVRRGFDSDTVRNVLRTAAAGALDGATG